MKKNHLQKQNSLYFNSIAPLSCTRRQISSIGADRDDFVRREAGDQTWYDGELRQRVADGSRFVRTLTNNTAICSEFQSQQIIQADALLSGHDMLARMQEIILNTNQHPDGHMLEEAIHSLAPKVFTVNSLLFRIAKRLAKYTRKRRRKDEYTSMQTHVIGC